MPIYHWVCKGEAECDYSCDVVRPMSEFEKGPDESCPKCGSQEFQRIIKEWKPYQTSLVHGGTAGWHNECYTRLGKPTGR